MGLHCHTDLARAQALAQERGPWGGQWASTPGMWAERVQVDRVVEGFLQDFGHLDVLGVQRGPGPAGAVHRHLPGQLAPDAGG